MLNLSDMVRGWFVGNFEPSVFKTSACEVGIHKYYKGEFIKAHHHKIATEITVVFEGSVRMFDTVYSSGDIIVIEPNKGSDFLALEDTTCVIVKVPGALNDKYEGLINE